MKRICKRCHTVLIDTEECNHCGSRYNTSEVSSNHTRPDLENYQLMTTLGFTAHHHLDDVNNHRVMPYQIPVHDVWYSRGRLHVYYQSMWYVSEWREGQLHVLAMNARLVNIIKSKKWLEVITTTNLRHTREEIS